jgi:type II secretory ATPase GspE/PulE/Tfp pilus assembly ATPase PilB-like protein
LLPITLILYLREKLPPKIQAVIREEWDFMKCLKCTEGIQDLILKHSTSSAIQKTAQAEGMVSMRQDGYLKAIDGHTTLLEVDRVASSEA